MRRYRSGTQTGTRLKRSLSRGLSFSPPYISIQGFLCFSANFYDYEDLSSIEFIPSHILGCFTAPLITPKWALFLPFLSFLHASEMRSKWALLTWSQPMYTNNVCGNCENRFKELRYAGMGRQLHLSTPWRPDFLWAVLVATETMKQAYNYPKGYRFMRDTNLMFFIPWVCWNGSSTASFCSLKTILPVSTLGCYWDHGSSVRLSQLVKKHKWLIIEVCLFTGYPGMGRQLHL